MFFVFYHRAIWGKVIKISVSVFRILRKLNSFTHDTPGEEKGRWAGKKKKKAIRKGGKKKKKKIGTTSLKQQGRCYSATDRLMMGKSEASSVHI